jgi:single-stranded DNA-binding protein
VGHVGKDPEFKTTSGGKVVASFSVAVSQKKDAPTYWYNCQAWEMTAESIRGLKKGDKVVCAGVMKSRVYNEKTYWEFTAYDIGIVGRVVKTDTRQTAASADTPPPPDDDNLPF